MASMIAPVVAIWYVVVITTASITTRAPVTTRATEDRDLGAELTKLQSTVDSLTRQIMMQQLNAEETSRSGGDSGMKQVRIAPFGTRPYYVASHVKNAVNAIHDHSQNTYTVGMGEVTVVMNGVEFRTRHNDYPLAWPSKKTNTYGKTEFVPYPDVPPEVLAKETLDEQITELQEWFKAWGNQDYSKRDYRKYFKPVLCYLEGAWTYATDEIEEPFVSDRHNIDATSYTDLEEKIRFTAYSGTKSRKENYSFLPKKIISLENGSDPVFAQWNYRIACVPTDEDIPFRYLRPINDFGVRMRDGASMEDFVKTRGARFLLEEFTPSNLNQERVCHFCLLDRLMEKIPGKDNFAGNLTDDSFGMLALHFERRPEVLNTAFYHRIYQSDKEGAMGSKKRNRGFADGNVFMAQTTQSKVVPMSVTDCPEDEECTVYTQRWSYAIPLEIIYMTPLLSWNPYDIQVTYYSTQNKTAWKAVLADGRDGSFTPEKAYDGCKRNIFYITPEEFFSGAEVAPSEADTSEGTVGVLDKNRNVRHVVASGHRIFLPDIPNVGILRTRYPITPLHNDGSQIYKEVEALKDAVMRMQTYQDMFTEPPL